MHWIALYIKLSCWNMLADLGITLANMSGRYAKWLRGAFPKSMGIIACGFIGPRAHIFMKHRYCTIDHCVICEGGLLICSVCGCAEGTLTTECAGIRVPLLVQNEVYEGYIDFFDGVWQDPKKKL